MPAGKVPVPRLHVVTDDAVLAGRARPGAAADPRPDFVSTAVEILRAGGSGVALHLRGPRTSGRLLHDAALALAAEAARHGSLLTVNDRADVAAAVSAGSGVRLGVHLGQRSVSAQEARRVFPGAAAVGVSVHSGEEAAAAAGADYLFAGTIFETPSHAGRAGAGVNRIHQVRESAPLLPIIAIGGVTPARVGGVLAAGAYGVAVLRGIWDAEDPTQAVMDYLAALG